ncbi:hypothetical protein FISHEDRAFT_32937 [Fistulina hepatica ATCC 64428]|uniref:Lysophospholipase n=1 Tax=Fistulina hepatica ATCC 64428 TaxID=1128425 RepID=A0A0D7AS32_9AGAR|nr:hypothetical protein FISHEDRAFT_32937 [Fistulina hepatica ATCC 64428]
MRLHLFLACSILACVKSVFALSAADYAPTPNVECPSSSLLRVFSASNQSLNADEASYVTSRWDDVLPDAWAAFLGNGSHIGYNLAEFSGNYSKIGIAISGGGYRAALYGAGVVSALDIRNQSAKDTGTGGLLQVASYLSALSGGSWFASSLYANHFPTISDLVFGNDGDLSGWLLDYYLLAPGYADVDENAAFYDSLFWAISAKADAGLALSYHFLNGTTEVNFFTNDSAHGAGQLWSRIPSSDIFQNYSVPYPIVIADSRPVGSNYDSNTTLNATVYELSPYEFASFDPDLSAAVRMQYLGTHLKDGEPDNDTACVTGFDEIGFVFGTSSSLFNELIDEAEDLVTADTFALLSDLVDKIINNLQNAGYDVANYPNPFEGIASSTFQDTNSTRLELIDGGLNGENIPLSPLLVKARSLDTIVAVETSADTEENWPNGTSLFATLERTTTLLTSSHQQLPPIPSSASDFISTGVNKRPTFFGCDPETDPPEYPLMIFLPNSPPFNGDDPSTNPSTFKLGYNADEVRVFIDQVHNNTISGFTPYSNDADANWGGCLQCAAVDRARTKGTNNITRSDFCAKCFKQYCYDPDDPPSEDELPNRKLDYKDPESLEASYFEEHEGAIIAGIVIAGVGVTVILAGCW